MNTRILLDQRENLSNSVIESKTRQYSNGKKLLSMLNGIGLEVEAVNDWTKEVEATFRAEYPNASLDFCLDAKGIKEPYRVAETFYKANFGNLSFEELTAEQLEAIKEQYCIFAETENQIEAFNLAHSVAKDLTRLKSLKMPIDGFFIMKLAPFLHKTDNGKIAVNEKSLNSYVQSLK